MVVDKLYAESATELWWRVCRASERWPMVERKGQPMRETPAVLVLTDPAQYLCTDPTRKANPWVSLCEFPWLLLGQRDVHWLAHYMPRASMFSDDGLSWRAAYGPRLYEQLPKVVQRLVRDPMSRQAVANVWDGTYDNVQGSRDYPCTLSLHFMQNAMGYLDLFVHMRSNDITWGLTGANIPNWCQLLHCVARSVGLGAGNYYHMADNLHVYPRDTYRALAAAAHPGHWGGFAEACAALPGPLDEMRTQLATAQQLVRHYWDRPNVTVMPSVLCNTAQLPVDSYPVQWAHFMLLWEVASPSGVARRYLDECGATEEVLEARLRLTDPLWRLAALDWLCRSGNNLNVEVATRMLRAQFGDERLAHRLEAHQLEGVLRDADTKE